MTLSELVRLLEECAEQYPEAEVRLAFQPQWPLRLDIHGVVANVDMDAEDGDGETDGARENIVWIVAGGHPYNESPYASKELWR